MGKPLGEETIAALNDIADELCAAASRELALQLSPIARPDEPRIHVRTDAQPIATTLSAHIRYEGTDTTLAVPFGDADAMAAAFVAAHTRRFGCGFHHGALIV